MDTLFLWGFNWCRDLEAVYLHLGPVTVGAFYFRPVTDLDFVVTEINRRANTITVGAPRARRRG
jgi:hypothetical protein